jgi:hypothetical protein
MPVFRPVFGAIKQPSLVQFPSKQSHIVEGMTLMEQSIDLFFRVNPIRLEL